MRTGLSGQRFYRLMVLPRFLVYFFGGVALPFVSLSLFFLIAWPGLLAGLYLAPFLGGSLFDPERNPFPSISWIVIQIAETIWALSPLFLGASCITRIKYPARQHLQANLWAFVAGLVPGVLGAILLLLVVANMTVIVPL